MKKFIPYPALVWSSLGAISYWLCFPRWSLFFLAPLPLFFYLGALERSKSWKQSMQSAFAINLIVGFGGFHWLTYAAHNFGQLPYILAFLALTLFACVAAPQVYLFFAIAYWIREKIHKQNYILKAFFYVSLYTSCEYLMLFLKLFPESLGNTLLHWPELAQNAAWGGAGALTFIPMLLGAGAYYFYRERKKIVLILASIILLTAFLWGRNELHTIATMPPTKKISVSMIQANIGDIDKLVSESGSRDAVEVVMKKYKDLTLSAPQSDLYVWPETAYPMAFPSRPDTASSDLSYSQADKLWQILSKKKSSMLLGGYEQTRGGDAEVNYNSAILLGSDGHFQNSYRKFLLLPFGEYIPLGDIFPILKKPFPQLGDFGRGEGPVPLLWTLADKSQVKIGVSICYEDVIASYMHGLKKNGADFFVNLTNDSWFGPGAEPWQHLELAALSAIENRTPMARSTNTGFSAFIDSTGRITKQGPLFEQAVVSDTIAIHANLHSLYQSFGNLFSYLCILFSLTVIILLQRKSN